MSAEKIKAVRVKGGQKGHALCRDEGGGLKRDREKKDAVHQGKGYFKKKLGQRRKPLNDRDSQ